MDDLLTELFEFAFEHGIAVTTTHVLSKDTPSVSRPSKNAIIVNMNWHTKKEIPMQFAHEIGHVLNEDKGTLYYCSTASHNSIEYGASKTGIKVLVSLYFQNVSPDEANSNTFVKQLAIPSYMEPYTEDCIREFYQK
ncbi:hypothetical protein [Furfurilactobacillus rossiae]|nr:hypothetical protein [Furfurilactobacillus rossiae]QFR66467.1 ImmA/IrrE family metallo-endopeptidase [Furfurilactobacillus rossiae]QLE61928.1 putative prophage protein [Furfurilactobacillus rossiae]